MLYIDDVKMIIFGKEMSYVSLFIADPPKGRKKGVRSETSRKSQQVEERTME